MTTVDSPVTSVLITGALGYIGRLTVAALAAERRSLEHIVAVDIREPGPGERTAGVEYVQADIRDPDLARVMRRFGVQVVVHLAAVVNPGKDADRDFLHDVEVGGTENLLDCCLAAGVDKIIVASSGAAYGYWPDNPEWLSEDDPLRGNREFAYSDHKRQVEEMLARWRQDHPELTQLILRPGTILGRNARNQITDLFDRPVVMGLAGCRIPFVLIWDQDVVGVIVRGIFRPGGGIYNLAGDGVITMRQMAAALGKPYLPLPVGLVKAVLWLMKKLGVTQYGPEQVGFLRYRPVLSNRRLKEEFGYRPRKSTREVFQLFVEARRGG